MHIDKACIKDVESILKIYNYYVINSLHTMDEKELTLKERVQWFNEHDERHPIFVAKKDFKVIGWASLSKYSEKIGYKYTVEISIYIDNDYQNKGIGTLLMDAIIDEARRLNVHAIISLITANNKASIKFHEKFKFFCVGNMEETGYKFGKYVDVVIYQLIL